MGDFHYSGDLRELRDVMGESARHQANAEALARVIACEQMGVPVPVHLKVMMAGQYLQQMPVMPSHTPGQVAQHQQVPSYLPPELPASTQYYLPATPVQTVDFDSIPVNPVTVPPTKMEAIVKQVLPPARMRLAGRVLSAASLGVGLGLLVLVAALPTETLRSALQKVQSGVQFVIPGGDEPVPSSTPSPAASPNPKPSPSTSPSPAPAPTVEGITEGLDRLLSEPVVK